MRKQRRPKYCTDCNCDLKIVKFHVVESTSPTIQVEVSDPSADKKFYMKACIHPRVFNTIKTKDFTDELKEDFRRMAYEQTVYKHIFKHFKRKDSDQAFKAYFIQPRTNQFCAYKNIKQLYKTIDTKQCPTCETDIVNRLIQTVCPKDQECPLSNDELDTFIHTIPILATVTEMCSKNIPLYDFLRQKRSRKVKRELIKKALDALNYAHSKLNLFHLDWHMSNILACKRAGTKKWQPLLFDWDRSTCFDLKPNKYNNVSVFLSHIEGVSGKDYDRVLNKLENKHMYRFIDRMYALCLLRELYPDNKDIELIIDISCGEHFTGKVRDKISDTLRKPQFWNWQEYEFVIVILAHIIKTNDYRVDVANNINTSLLVK